MEIRIWDFETSESQHLQFDFLQFKTSEFSTSESESLQFENSEFKTHLSPAKLDFSWDRAGLCLAKRYYVLLEMKIQNILKVDVWNAFPFNQNVILFSQCLVANRFPRMYTTVRTRVHTDTTLSWSWKVLLLTYSLANVVTAQPQSTQHNKKLGETW